MNASVKGQPLTRINVVGTGEVGCRLGDAMPRADTIVCRVKRRRGGAQASKNRCGTVVELARQTGVPVAVNDELLRRNSSGYATNSHPE